MNKKGRIIVICCICLGILLVGISFFYQWFVASGDMQFSEWLSSQGKAIVLEVILQFGLSLISAAVFLVFVEASLNALKDKDNESMQENKWKAYIIKKMRVSPKEALEEIRLRDKIPVSLFSNQIFNGCDFSECVLDSLDFSGSSFIDAKFHFASCIGCNFSSCNLEKATFVDANLSYVNLTNAQNIATLDKAKALFHATMPDGSIYNNEYGLAEDIIQAQKLGQ